jgi:hypothetical protein
MKKAAEKKKRVHKKRLTSTTGIKTPIIDGVTAFENLCVRNYFLNSFNKTQAYLKASAAMGRDVSDMTGARQNAYTLFNRPRVRDYISNHLAQLDITKGIISARLDALFEEDIGEAVYLKKRIVGKDDKEQPLFNEIGKDENGQPIYEETYDISLSKIKELGLFHLVKKLKYGMFGLEIEFHQQRRKEVLDSLAKLQGYIKETNDPDDNGAETPLVRFQRMLEESLKNASIRTGK